MSHYNRYYNKPDRKQNDADAIEDARQYASKKMWDFILVEAGKVEAHGTAEAFQQLNFALGFCGIQGYPVQAIGRTFCKTAFRAWMHDGDDPVMTDEDGFALETEAA